MLNHILNEISPLSDRDCFYIVDRRKTEFTYPIHQHREFELNFVENAAGVRRIVGDSSETIGDYDLVLLCGENLAHAWEQGACRSREIREITIQFAPDSLPASLLAKNQFASIRTMFERARNGLAFPMPTILRIYSLLDELSRQQGFVQWLRILETLYLLSLSRQARTLSSSAFSQSEPTADSRRVSRVEEYVRNHFAGEIRLATLAEIAGMSPAAFSRFFSLRAGRSVTDYIIDIRLGVATRQLADSTKTVAEISYECGFNTLANFNRIFKKKKGMTPKEFREQYRKKKILC